MIFCFDSQHAYILGEATQTLSFEDDDIHDKGDSLWLGMTKIPRGGSVCEHTVELPTNHGSNANDEDASKIHIVNDLREDSRFCNQPYVTGGIKARFYAGVPITTEKGFNIGAFCILDDNPRQGLKKKDVRFIQEMGSLVMEHLEMLKARAEQRRGTLMVKALNSFMENEPGAPQEPNKSAPATITSTLEAIAQATDIANMEGTEASEHLVEQLTLQHKLEDEESLLTTGRTLNSIVAEANNNVLIAPEIVRPSMSRRDSTKSNTGLVPKKEEDPLKLRDQVASNAMQSAADFIRTAVGADGVLFLDASMSNFGEMAEEDAIDNTKPGRELESFTSDTDGAGSATDTLDRPNNQEDDSKPCSVFGASYGLVPANFTPPHDAIPKKLLQSLLRCHKHGKVFLYGAEGDYTSDTHTSDGSSFFAAQSISLTSTTGRGVNGPPSQRRKRSTRSSLGRKLGALFPEARSLMLLGLWNMSRDRWDAGCIVYSNSPIRVFSLDSEMCYLKAFCDVITAKIGRLDMEMSHKVKSDFMSSISHELRSPLHGILGTAEFIHDQIHDDETSEMIGQIQVCGQTLLDVVDHLLDFSKVNSVSKHNRKQLGADQRVRNRSNGLSRAETLGGMVIEKTNVLLDELTEEVIDTAVYSFCCSKDGQTLDQRKVTVITDIDPSALSLSCVIAVGAWKRLCINLINNALKYTERGYIVASLKLMPPTERQKRPRARLTITDSGRGISKEFMASQLFRAFSQEDEFAEGTGLGMSMVAKIVKSLGGHIDVQSKKEVGTTVSVTLPLDVRGTGDVQRIHNRTLSSGPNMISMHCLGFAPMEPHREKSIMAGRDFQIETLRKTCRQLNVMVSPSSWSAPGSFDLAMVTEEDVPELLRILQPNRVRTPHAGPDTIRAIRTKPLLVICRNCRSRRELKESALNQLTHAHIEYVAQPCGPQKLADAIRRCLSSTPNDEPWSENSTTPKANSLQRPVDPGFPFPARRLSEDPNMQTPRPPLPESFRLGDDKPPSLPKDSPMDGIEQQTTVTVTTKTTRIKMPKPATEIDPSKPTLLLVDDNVSQCLHRYYETH
jgi:signal transduction histidine kinase/GAF domain-containing protein